MDVPKVADEQQDGHGPDDLQHPPDADEVAQDAQRHDAQRTHDGEHEAERDTVLWPNGLQTCVIDR